MAVKELKTYMGWVSCPKDRARTLLDLHCRPGTRNECPFYVSHKKDTLCCKYEEELMKAVCVLTEYDEVVPFWGIVIFDEQKTTLEDAIKKEYRERYSEDSTEEVGNWYSCLEDENIIYLPVDVGRKLKDMTWPENYGFENTIASHHEMMLCVCKALAEEEE